MLKKVFHRLLSGGIFWQIVAWTIGFVVIFALIHKISSINVSELFHSMTSYDRGTNLGYAILYILGVGFFSGLLVMILTNGIRNRINSIERGDVRYPFRKHVVFLGYNDLVLGILSSCPNKRLVNRLMGIVGGKFFVPNYVILVEKNVSQIREELVGVLGSRNNIYVLHGNRTSYKDLSDIYITKASEIYVIGENEADADVRNFQSLKQISEQIGAEYSNKIIFLYNYPNSNFCSWDYCCKFLSKDFLNNNFLKVIDYDELSVNNILGDPDNQWPNYKLHQRNKWKDNVIWDSDQYVHLVIFGMNEVAKKLIKSAGNHCHFPNHSNKGINTKITIIDECIEDASYITHSFGNYFKLCTYEVKCIENGEMNVLFKQNRNTNCQYIDIDFEFIDTKMSDALLQNEIAKWASDKNQILSLYTCIDDFKLNLAFSTSLPHVIYESNIPIWMYTRETNNISLLFRNSYPNIISWGSSWDLHSFGKWNRDTTVTMCKALKCRQPEIPTHIYYQEFLNFSSFLSILHTCTARYVSDREETRDELRALAKTEYYRNCANALMEGKTEIDNLLILSNEDNWKHTPIMNIDELDNRKHYFEKLLFFGLDVFQGRKIMFNNK